MTYNSLQNDNKNSTVNQPNNMRIVSQIRIAWSWTSSVNKIRVKSFAPYFSLLRMYPKIMIHSWFTAYFQAVSTWYWPDFTESIGNQSPILSFCYSRNFFQSKIGIEIQTLQRTFCITRIYCVFNNTHQSKTSKIGKFLKYLSYWGDILYCTYKENKTQVEAYHSDIIKFTVLLDSVMTLFVTVLL